MSDENEMKRAQAVYNSLCEMLDERGWKYDKYDEKLTIRLDTRGEDLEIEIYNEVDSGRQLVSLLSQMPFAIPEDRRSALAVAVCQANNGMVDGSFDYDYIKGNILFRLTSSYRESLISKNLLEYMLMCACFTIDHYNDKFLTVAKNEMTADEIEEYL